MLCLLLHHVFLALRFIMFHMLGLLFRDILFALHLVIMLRMLCLLFHNILFALHFIMLPMRCLSIFLHDVVLSLILFVFVFFTDAVTAHAQCSVATIFFPLH